METDVRRVRVEDAPVLAVLAQANRAFLAPWEPVRPVERLTPAGQLAELQFALTRYEVGTSALTSFLSTTVWSGK